VIAVVDFGGGNLGSLRSGLERRGAKFVVTGDPAALDDATAAILPGDGAFGATMAALDERGLADALRRFIASGRPFLGICVGMQLLYEKGYEHDVYTGLGVLPGSIVRFRNAPRVPHMGWNQLEIVGDHPFVRGVRDGDYVYFLHSYHADDASSAVAVCDYGERFPAVVARDNVMGTQFHPEKSQATGAVLLDNFLALAGR
jgi:glutamine amidotransferase